MIKVSIKIKGQSRWKIYGRYQSWFDATPIILLLLKEHNKGKKLIGLKAEEVK